MTTYVCENISDFIDDHLVTSVGKTILVLPCHEDIFISQKQFFEKVFKLTDVKICSIDQVRSQMCKNFGIKKNICPDFLLSLFVREGLLAYKNKKIESVFSLVDMKSISNAVNIVAQAERQHVPFDEEILYKIFASFRKDMTSYILESDIDQLLLKNAISLTEKFDSHIIFFGCQPFPKWKTLMEAVSASYRSVDVVVQDFGDSELHHLWLSTLFKICGEYEFLPSKKSELQQPDSVVKFRIFDTIVDEVDETCKRIQSLIAENGRARIGICSCENKSPHIPLLHDRLFDLKISYCDVSRQRMKCFKYHNLVSLWGNWQIERDIDSCTKFCAELAKQHFISDDFLEKFFRECDNLQSKCLTSNYDVMIEFANLKNVTIFDFLEKYDFFGEKISLKKFCDFLENAFSEILESNVLDIFKCGFLELNLDNKFSTKNLISSFCEFIKSNVPAKEEMADQSVIYDHPVIICDIEFAGLSKMSHVFVVGMTARNFDSFKKNTLISDEDIGKINASTVIINNSEDKEIRSGENYIQTNQDYKFLQRSIFRVLAKNTKITVSCYKNGFSCVETQQDPASIFHDLMFDIETSNFSSEKNHLSAPSSSQGIGDSWFSDWIMPADHASIQNCVTSYHRRHDLSSFRHAFCFSMDKHNKPKFSCKGLEYLLKNPHVGFYDFVLSVRRMPWQREIFEKKIIIGSMVHDFLQILKTDNSRRTHFTLENFYNNIIQRSCRLKNDITKACLSADAALPIEILRILDFSAVTAQRLSKKLFQLPNILEMRSEFSLPPGLTVLFENAAIELTGRLDILCSVISEKNNWHLSKLIIDFKTGRDIELTEKNIKTHMQRYSNLQLILYGLAIKTLGFKDIKLIILKPDSSQFQTSVDLYVILSQIPDVIDKLSETIESGIIERQIFGKSGRDRFIKNLPLATTDLY